MSSIGKNFLYVCSYNSKGKWSVRKVDKRTSETVSEYSIEQSKCECKGFEHHDKCKHVEMITGKFVKGKGMRKVGEKANEVVKFLDEYTQAHFDAKHKVKFLEEHGEIAERFDILCEADERKVLWTQIMTPTETERGKGLPVLVRLIFTVSFDDDVESF